MQTFSFWKLDAVVIVKVAGGLRLDTFIPSYPSSEEAWVGRMAQKAQDFTTAQYKSTVSIIATCDEHHVKLRKQSFLRWPGSSKG